jgi:hypothetical protein
LPGVKRLGCGADHPPLSSAEVKKEYSYTSTPLWAFGSVTGYLYLFILGFLHSEVYIWQKKRTLKLKKRILINVI